MKKLFFVFFAAVLCLSAAARDFSIESYKISGLSPKSMSVAEGSFDFTIANRGLEMSFKNASGMIFHKGQALGKFKINDFSVPASSTTTVTVSGRLELTNDRNWMNMLTIIPGFSLNDFTVDFCCDARYKGISRRFDLNGLNVGEFVHKK